MIESKFTKMTIENNILREIEVVGEEKDFQEEMKKFQESEEGIKVEFDGNYVKHYTLGDKTIVFAKILRNGIDDDDISYQEWIHECYGVFPVICEMTNPEDYLYYLEKSNYHQDVGVYTVYRNNKVIKS